MVGLLAGLASIGVVVAALRAEQSRHLRRIQELQHKQTELTQRLWSQEMELARLRSPQMIRERAARFGLEVAEPPSP
jgi:hypothetical protein